MRFSHRLILLYLVMTGAVLLAVLWMAPRFAYTLDDPYIHLALAQNILHGTYGINPGETTSPSSSVIWPFLLAPLSESAFRFWVPFLENILFGVLLCALLGTRLHEAVNKTVQRESLRWLLAFLWVLSCNMVGLAFVGMEHTLQVLVVAGCAFALADAASSRQIGGLCLACAFIAPSVRYDNLLFTVGVVAALWLQKRRRTGIVLLVTSLLPLLVFGIFLHTHKMGWVPNSVVAKSGIVTARHHVRALPLALDHALAVSYINWKSLFVDIHRVPVLVLLGTFLVLLWRKKANTQETGYWLVGLAVTCLTISYAPYGWFYRYDVALRAYLLILTFMLALATEPFAARRWIFWLAPACTAPLYLVVALLRTPPQAQAMALEHYQLYRLEHDDIQKNVACDDLGLAAVDNAGKYYVLDLQGLASNDTLRVNERNAAWLDGVTRKHDIEVAFVYLYKSVPETWTLLGTLVRNHTLGDTLPPEMRIYAVKPGHAEAMRKQVSAFAATLPHGASIAFPPAAP